MKNAATRLNEASEVTIPLRNLISMIAFTGVSVWVYFGLVERIAFLEHNLELTMAEIDEFEPPKSVQDTVARVHDLEIEIARIKLLLESK